MLVLLSTLLLVGCDPASDPECDFKCDKECCNETQNGTDNEPEQTPEVIPTFAELVEINDIKNILKTKTNIYASVKSTSENPNYSYEGEAIYFKGEDGGFNYHNVHRYDDGETYYNSGVGNVYYSSNGNDVTVKDCTFIKKNK